MKDSSKFPELFRGTDFYYEVDPKTGYRNSLFRLGTIATVFGSTPERIKVVVRREKDKASMEVERLK